MATIAQSARVPAQQHRPRCAAPGRRGGRRSSRFGVTLVYMAVLMVLLLGFVSLAVDWGRVQMIKTQLLRAADAGARYAATGIADGTYSAKAISAAGANKADETSVIVQSSDVVLGNYNPLLSPTFSTARTPLNAVQVTAARTQARGNAIGLKFGER